VTCGALGVWPARDHLSHALGTSEGDGNLYPTHGLGPIAQRFDVNRGDAFDYLVSMSSNARGLDLYAREPLPETDARRDADTMVPTL